MTHEELQKKHGRLIDLLRKMRGYQKEYFRYRASSDREHARRYEREVDKIIEEEVKMMKSGQKELF